MPSSSVNKERMALLEAGSSLRFTVCFLQDLYMEKVEDNNWRVARFGDLAKLRVLPGFASWRNSGVCQKIKLRRDCALGRWCEACSF